MEQILVHQIVRSEFCQQVLFAHQVPLVQCKTRINMVISNRPVDDIVIMHEILVHSVVHHEIYPLVCWRIENGAIKLLQSL